MAKRGKKGEAPPVPWWQRGSTIVASIAALVGGLATLIVNYEKIEAFVRSRFFQQTTIILSDVYAVPAFITDKVPPTAPAALQEFNVTVRFVYERTGKDEIECSGQLLTNNIIYDAIWTFDTPADSDTHPLKLKESGVRHESGFEFEASLQNFSNPAAFRLKCKGETPKTPLPWKEIALKLNATYELCIGQERSVCEVKDTKNEIMRAWAPCGWTPEGWAKTSHPNLCVDVSEVRVKFEKGSDCGYTVYRINCSASTKSK